MTPVYHELLKRVWQMAGQERQQPSEDVAEFLRDLKARQLILGAPKEMIEAFNRWEREASAAQEKGNGVALVFAWEELLRGMRRDLGHDDSGLPRGELLRVFMEDFDQFLPELDAAAEGGSGDGRRRGRKRRRLTRGLSARRVPWDFTATRRG